MIGLVCWNAGTRACRKSLVYQHFLNVLWQWKINFINGCPAPIYLLGIIMKFLPFSPKRAFTLCLQAALQGISQVGKGASGEGTYLTSSHALPGHMGWHWEGHWSSVCPLLTLWRAAAQRGSHRALRHHRYTSVAVWQLLTLYFTRDMIPAATALVFKTYNNLSLVK